MTAERPAANQGGDDLVEWLRSFVAERSFLARYPLYAGVLARMRPVADPSVEIMAVSLHEGRFYLHVNVDYFLRAPHHLRGVLLHEVHHVVLGHLTHPKFHDPAHPDLMDIAKEVSANEFLEEPLPDGIFLRDFERFGLRAGQSTMQRYDALVKLRQDDKLKLPSQLRFVDEHRRGGLVPDGSILVRQLIEGAIEDRGESEDTRSRLAGKLPSFLLSQLDDERPPERPVDWKTALRMFTARQRAPRHTYARPNRRFPGRVGEVPGRVYSTREIERPRLLVVIDTSGSMAQRDLDEIARQIRLMTHHALFSVAECDAAVHRVYGFPGRIEAVMGRGGTDLRPVFDEAFRRQHRVEGVVYFTDGDGPFLPQDPGVPTLWVLTSGEPFACPWGQRVRM